MAEVMNRLKLEVAQKRVRPKEFFSDFDGLRRGEVSEAQFKRALSQMNFSLSHLEMDNLAASFRIRPGIVDYRRFLEEMDSFFLDQQESSPYRAAVKQIGGESLTVTQVQQVNRAMEDFRQLMKVKRIFVKPLFKDFDRSQTGHVTVSQFRRALNTSGYLPSDPAVVELIIRKYQDSALGVNYQKFCIDVDQVDTIGGLHSGPVGLYQDTQLPKPPTVQDLITSRFFDTYKAVYANPLQVEERLKAEVAMKGIRASEFFRDFDKLRKGAVCPSHFRTAFGMLRISLNQAQLNSIMNKHRQQNGDIRYIDLCRFIQSSPQLLDKLPEQKAVTSIDTMPARRQFLDFSQQQKQYLLNTLKDFQQIIKHTRVHMRPIFQDFDTSRTGHVSRTQFSRVLNQLNLAPSGEAIRLLLKRYIDKGNMEQVNYMDFCKDVDIPQQIFTPESVNLPPVDQVLQYRKQNLPNLQYTTNASVDSKFNAPPPEDLEDLLSRIRQQVQQYRIRILEFIRDFDRLRTGIVSKSQIRSAFSMAKIPLTDPEFSLLCRYYQVDTLRMNYFRLVDDIEIVFTDKRLEKTNTQLSFINTSTKYGVSPLSNEQIGLAESTVQKFRSFMVNKYIDIKSHFQDWDRHNSYKISPKQFRQVLAHFGFIMTDQELAALSRKYNSSGSILYLDFIQDSKLRAFQDYREDMGQSQIVRNGSFNINNPYCMNRPNLENMETLLRRIQQGVKTKRIRAQEFMTEHDPLRKGIIPKSKFRSALDNMKLDLSSADLDLLQSFYSINRDQVNYSELIKFCQEVFTLKELEKAPAVRPEDTTFYLDPRDNLDKIEEQTLEEALQRLGFLVKTRRAYIKPFFQDKDKVNAGWVTSTRFRSVMAFAGLPISDREFEVLCKRFAYRRNEVNYVEFCQAIAHYAGDDKPF